MKKITNISSLLLTSFIISIIIAFAGSMMLYALNIRNVSLINSYRIGPDEQILFLILLVAFPIVLLTLKRSSSNVAKPAHFFWHILSIFTAIASGYSLIVTLYSFGDYGLGILFAIFFAIPISLAFLIASLIIMKKTKQPKIKNNKNDDQQSQF